LRHARLKGRLAQAAILNAGKLKCKFALAAKGQEFGFCLINGTNKEA